MSEIPGVFLGGVLTDRILLGAVPTFLAALACEGVDSLLIPYLGLGGVEVAAAIIGQQGSVFRISDIPTAVGLMLTIAAVGGAVVPPLYSQIASDFGSRAAWTFEGVISLGFACLALAARPATSVSVAPAIRVG